MTQRFDVISSHWTSIPLLKCLFLLRKWYVSYLVSRIKCVDSRNRDGTTLQVQLNELIEIPAVLKGVNNFPQM